LRNIYSAARGPAISIEFVIVYIKPVTRFREISSLVNDLDAAAAFSRSKRRLYDANARATEE